ncbi:3850_t:CDS:2 [Dentiscutata erythropus]|uniref:3850_t:CDS:1 n=1 Tax=Dentiscutata erythropus TaxID=1348616 RepID=A0A9N9A8V7_9GLOM|nr:3850_t:CDS:2 [Dentiscutata erythropus]
MFDYKQFYVRLIYIIIFLFLTAKSNDAAENLSPGNCVQTYDSGTDYFPSKVTVTTASLFTIKYNNNYKLVMNTATKDTFALVQCGTPVPTGLPAGTKVFNISLNNVAVMDTSVVPYLEALGLRSHITALGSPFVTSPCLQALNSNLTIISTDNMTLEIQQLSKVDASFDSMSNLSDPKSISISAASDPGPLNRAEWIKFFSVFFNLEDSANTFYNQISDNYNCLKKLPSSNSHPLVAWVAYNEPSSFNNNTASWTINDAPYKKIFTEDAGGTYFNSTTLSYSTSSSFLSAISNVDILIDETFVAPNISAFYTNFNLNSNDNQYKFIKNNAIYREDGLSNPSDGRDWFENAILLADDVLEDMMNVINPNLPTKDYKRLL